MTATVPSDELVLDRTAPVYSVPVLDPVQAQVLAHESGPLLVLGGPGTGKTTALVSAAAARVTAGTDAARVLLLTLGRTAVTDLRTGLAARLPDHTIPDVRTWHGFAYSVVDADRVQRAQLSESGEQAAVVGPLQLLTGAEYEARVRELVLGSLEDRTSPWPKSLEPALTTRGFARDVRALLVQLRTLGLEPFDLDRIAKTLDDAGLRDTLLAAAAFAETAFDVFDFEGVTDHADVLHRAGLVLAESLVPAYDAVYVDQAHDLDPAMTRVLAQLARGGTTVVLAADPDQAVESFRGSEPRLLGELEERVFGRPVPTLVLPTDHAHSAALRAVIERVTARIPAAALPADVVRQVRAALPGEEIADAPSRVLIKTFDSAAAEASHVSDLLLRRHSDATGALAWSDMAVVVHGPAAFAPFARAFNNAGIPFEIPRDEVPLRDDPAARVLLTVLELAVQKSAGRLPTPELVRSFVLGPLVRVDSAALRRLSRALRAAARAAGDVQITADQALVQAVLDPKLLLDLPDDDAADALVAGARVLAAAVAAVTARRPVSEALWTVWTAAAHYGERLGAAALRGGSEGRRADRDLDAVMGLFDAAERADARYQGRRGVGAFLDELRTLDFASESLAERGAPAPAVTVLTARRARGQFWPLVVVAGVNDGEWPLVSASHNIVGADRLTSDGISPAPTRSARLADERRVFHVAVSRSLSELVVTAVASADDDGPQPSRFVRDLCVGLDIDLTAAHTRGYPRRALNVNGLVSSIRRLATEETASDHAVHAAATRLAKLAALTDPSGRALVHGANPAYWWGVRDVTVNATPINDPNLPVRMSATGLQAIEDCGLRRFFEKEAAAHRPDTQPAAFGTVVHSVAEALIDGSLPAESEAVEAVIDAVWPQLASDAAWASAQERVEATEISDRLLAWHLAERGRVPVKGEQKFDIVIDVSLPDGRSDSVELVGSIDRVEVDVDDPAGVHIVDFKTSRYVPVIKTLEQHPQLGVYRLIVEAGAVDDIVPNAHVAGAELVELRHVDKDGNVKIYSVSGPTDGTWPDRLGVAAAVVRDEVLDATPSDQVCRTCPLARLCPAKSAGRQVLP